MTKDTNRGPRRERILLAGLCGVLGAWIGITSASDLNPVTLGSSRGDSVPIGQIHSIAVSGPYVYLACGGAGMEVLDVRDPARPKAVSRYRTQYADWADDGQVRRIALSGDYAYLKVGLHLEIVDIRDPVHPARVSVSYDGGDWSVGSGLWSELVVEDGHIYLGGSPWDNLRVLEVSDVANLRQVAELPVQDRSMAIAGHHLYLGTRRGLEVWHVAEPAKPERVGMVAIDGAQSVALAGNYALVASHGVAEPGHSVLPGLEIIDIQQPGNPRVVGRYATDGSAIDGPALALAVASQRAFLAVGPELTVIDISDPAQPRRLASYDNGLSTVHSGWTQIAVAAQGNTCYFAAGPTLDLIDTSEPASPRRQSTFADLGGAADIAISGQFALVADGQAGLRVFDISDAAHPTSRCWVQVGLSAHAVAVSDRLACVAFRGSGDASRLAGLALMDITDPANPSTLSRVDMVAQPDDVVLVGGYLYATVTGVGEDGLQVFDVSDPVHPRQVGDFPSGFGRSLAVSGNHLFVTASGLQVFDISNPTSPTRVGWLRGEVNFNTVAIGGQVACVTDGGGVWLHLVDISDPTNPRLRGRRPGSNFGAVAISGNLAWAGEELIDISDPTDPRRVAGGPAGEVMLMVDQLAYVGEAYGGLKTVDLGRVANPQRVGANPAISPSSAVDIVGRYAYLASWDDGLQVVDIANVARPESVGRVRLPGVARGVAVQGAFAYLASDAAGLRVVDVSNPAAPRLAGAAPTIGEALDVAVSGSLACVASTGGGMQVFDISDPLHPLPMGRYNSTPGISRLAVSGNRAYLAGEFVLEVIDISQPAAPRSIAGPLQVDFLGFPTSVPVGYAEDPDERWQLSDLTDPAHPKPIGGYRMIAKARGIALSGQYAFTMGWGWERMEEGLKVYDLSDRSRPRLIGRNTSSRYPSAVALADGRIWLAGDGYPGSGEGLIALEMLPFIRSISHQAGHLQLDWEGWGRARLEVTASLTNPDWRDVGIPEMASSALLPLTGPHAYFRLQTPRASTYDASSAGPGWRSNGD